MGKGRALYERDWDWNAYFFREPKGIAMVLSAILGVVFVAWKVTRPEFSAEPVGPHVQAKFVTVHIAKGKRSEFKSLFTTQLAVGLDIKKTQVQVLGMKDFESESKVALTGLLVAITVPTAREVETTASLLLEALESPRSKLRHLMPSCKEHEVEQCVAKDTVYINYGYNPEIKGGGKDTDASPLTAAGGGASIGESGHVMVGSDPTVVTLGAVYKRPVVVAGVPRYPPACRVGSESQTEGAECDEVVPRINIETGASADGFREFTVYLEEPACRDGVHAVEQLPWMVIEAGSYHDDTGGLIAAGAADATLSTDVTKRNWVPVAFPLDGFDDDSVMVLTQIMTARDFDPNTKRGAYLKVKQKNLRDDGFDVALDTDYAPTKPIQETIGYIAATKGAGQFKGAPYEAGRVENGFQGSALANSDFSVKFEAAFSPTETILLFSSLSVELDDKPHPGLRSTEAGPPDPNGQRGAGFYFEHNRCLGPPPKEPDLDVVSWFAIHPHRDDGFMAYARKDCKGIAEGPNKMDMCGVCDTTPANDCVVDCSGSWGGTRLMCEGVCLEYGKTCGGAGSIGGLQIKHIVVVLLVAGVGFVAWKKRHEDAMAYASVGRADVKGASSSEVKSMLGGLGNGILPK